MGTLGQIPRIVTGMVALSAVLLLALFSASSIDSQAQPPPPPSKTAITPVTNTPTPTPTDTSTPSGANTPTRTATWTPTPTTQAATSTSTPTGTWTPTPTPSGTSSPTPSRTYAPPPHTPTATAGPKPTHEPRPGPKCQSVVEGYVLNIAGQRTAGATVRITNSGYSNQVLTDDSGKYAFSGLCAGSYTVQATLPSGRLTNAASATVDGQNSTWVDLQVPAAGTSTPGSTNTARPIQTTEADMPTTGNPGWLLIGGALLGVLLLLSAGARRAFR